MASRSIGVRLERSSLGAQRFDAGADRLAGARGQNEVAVVDQPLEGIERGCAVARLGERAGVIARLLPPARGVGNERR